MLVGQFAGVVEAAALPGARAAPGRGPGRLPACRRGHRRGHWGDVRLRRQGRVAVALRPRDDRARSGPSSALAGSALEGLVLGQQLPPRTPAEGALPVLRPGRRRGPRDDPDLDVEVIALGWRFFQSAWASATSARRNSLGEHADRTRYSEAVRRPPRVPGRGDLSAKARDPRHNPLRVPTWGKRPEDRAVGCPRVADHLSDDRRLSRTASPCASPRLDAGHPYTVHEDRLVRDSTTTGTTFESTWRYARLGPNAIGGGGCYDRLAEDLGGPPTDGHRVRLGVDRRCWPRRRRRVPAPCTDDAFVVDLVGGDACPTHPSLRAAGLSASRTVASGPGR